MIQSGVAWAGSLANFEPEFAAGWGMAKNPADVFFDLASLTKPIVTSTLLVDFCLSDAIDLKTFREKKLSYYWGTLKAPVANLTIAQVWDHRSGLKAHIELAPKSRHCFSGNRAELWDFVMERIYADGIAGAAGAQTTYSDLNFWLLGALLEHVQKNDLAHLWTELKSKYDLPEHDLIFGPVLTANTVVPTEKRHQEGEVNDDNAIFMQQLAPHAGLFGTANGVWSWLKLMKNWHSQPGLTERIGDYFKPAHNERFWCGWDRPTGPRTQAGEGAPLGHALGHLGYTGTAFWWDPESLWGGLLLTNRIRPSHSEVNLAEIRELRVKFFSLLWQNNKRELWKTLLEQNSWA